MADPDAAGPVWLKVVPPFFAHEGAMLERIAIGPPVLATDGPRSLLADVPGEDLYEPSPAQVAAMVRLLVAEQARWIDRVDEVLALGAPDWRGDAFVALAADVVARTTDELDAATAAAARRLVDELPATFTALAACGIPDSLVHGDFHGGNVRADGERLVLLDWGDSGVGHPLLDQPAALEHLAGAVAASARAAWTAAWLDAVPGSDPERAGAPRAAGRRPPPGRHLPALPRRHRARRAAVPPARPGRSGSAAGTGVVARSYKAGLPTRAGAEPRQPGHASATDRTVEGQRMTPLFIWRWS